MNQHTLFTKVQDYYTDLVAKLGTAQNEISMTYLSFDSGEWAARISDVLCAKAQSGVTVRLMVDEVGQFIGANTQLMLTLQTITEQLGTLCQGRAWVISLGASIPKR